MYFFCREEDSDGLIWVKLRWFSFALWNQRHLGRDWGSLRTAKFQGGRFPDSLPPYFACAVAWFGLNWGTYTKVQFV